MSSFDIDKLLTPISEEAPCGPDLEYDSEFGELERSAQGKPEQQVGDSIVAAEPPDWKAVKKLVDSLLTRTRDMRVAVYFARCSLNLEGITGFERGLHLLRAYLETFWDSVHPELDHDDNDDPTYRTNTLITLCDEEGLLRELREAPLVSSRMLGQFGMRDIERARHAEDHASESDTDDGWGSQPSTDDSQGAGAPDLTQIEAAFSDADLEQLQATETTIATSADHVAAIEQFVTEQVGVAQAVSLAPIREVLEQMKHLLVSQLERRGVYTDQADEAANEEQSGLTEQAAGGMISQPAVTPMQNGRIESREQVVRVLDAVCDFYDRHEPSSPVPLLIRRAQRLASKSFLEILRDLAPDGVAQAEAWSGTGSGGGTAPEESSSAESSDDGW